MSVQGIDVSIWQDQNSTAQMMDFAKAKANGAKFVFIKASQALYVDQDFVMNWANAKAAGLARGPYHFLVWDKTGAAQADYLWSLLRNDPGELEIVVDFEWWSTIPLHAFTVLRAFLEQMKAYVPAKRLCIYTAKAFWDVYGQNDPYWKQYSLWLCDITGPVEVPAPWTTYLFHQYSFGKGQGLAYGAESLDIDLDYFNGTQAEFEARYSPTPVVVPVPPVEETVTLTTQVNNQNVRANPSTASAVTGQLSAGQIVTILEIKVIAYGNIWARVKCGAVTGWAALEYSGVIYLK